MSSGVWNELLIIGLCAVCTTNMLNMHLDGAGAEESVLFEI